ncbi:MAG: choice-of-anchor B family protein [Bacteroidia bacterium]|nr:choice-of-anchor B family protein [Bacteroidia bacterium]
MKKNKVNLKYWLPFIALLLLQNGIFAQAQFTWNTTLLGHWDNNSLPSNSGVTYNDVWGYAANGREYGIFGTLEGTYFFDITTPTSPVQVGYFAGQYNNSIWRDIKTYGTYAYSIADAGTSSLQVFDLSDLPNTVTKVYDSNTFFARAHNIFINESNGRMYVAGSNTVNTGLIVLDLSSSPESPTLLGNFNLGNYVHDLYVNNDTVYCFMANSGMQIWDFSDLGAVSQIGNLATYPEQGYCHQGYGYKRGKNLVFADETHDMGIKVLDVSDPSNIQVEAVFRSGLLAPGFTDNIPHNIYMKGDIAFISYYHDGLQVYDLSTPSNPVNIAYYDTDTTPFYFGYFGLWGVYPYLPSGNILGTDIAHGFFVWDVGSLFPVEFGSFSAENQAGDVLLKWQTQSETNNSHFVVERSLDGKSFDPIDQVAGAGTTTEVQYYSLLDENPNPGMNFYRIKQVDLDGGHNYSEVVNINLLEDFDLTALYPNPVKHNAYLNLSLNLFEDEQVYLCITDLLGKEVRAWNEILPAGIHELHLPMANLAPGTYAFKAVGSKTRLTRKVIVE